MKADLTKIKTEELEAEIKRRKDRHDFIIQGMAFTLNLEEVIELQKELNKINPQKSPLEEYAESWKKITEEKSKNSPLPWVQPPINPGWPKYPENPDNPYGPVKIWYGGETSPR